VISLLGARFAQESPTWKPEHRQAAKRDCLRYPSDLTDAELALVGPMIPPAKRGGRPREVDDREVLNAILYVLPPAASGRRYAEEHRAPLFLVVGLGRHA
jgi:Putative transposase of IS4/5 family (DUF4096)